MDLEKILNNPLIHSFKTNGHYYLYDTSSNEIIKTDSLSYRLFKKEIDNTLRMYCSISEKNPRALNDLTGLEPFED